MKLGQKLANYANIIYKWPLMAKQQLSNKKATTKGSFTYYVMHFSLLFDHPPTYGYVFAMILLNI